MKYNNKLNLVEYLKVVNEIVNEFFDMATDEYTPQIGEIYAVCAYFNHCVKLENKDEIKVHPIEDIMDMDQLFDNNEFMSHYNYAVYNYEIDTPYLTFGRAYEQAKSIVEYKKNDANQFATAIVVGLEAVLKSFKESFSEEDVAKIAEIAKEISSGKLSNESIVKAYENSERFKENTAEMKTNTVVQFPDNK